MFIAMCFKNVTPCDGSEDSKRWEWLVDDFFQKANSLISSLQLNGK